MGLFDGAFAGVGDIAKTVTQTAPRKAVTKKRTRTSSSSGGTNVRSRNTGNSNASRSRQPTVNRPTVSRPAVGSTSKGTVAPSVPAPAKPPMTLDQWLATDTAYQSQKKEYDQALRDYTTNDTAERAKYENEYKANLAKMETEKQTAQTALNDDYASRGMLSSGLYADALNDFQNNYATKQADAQRARTAYLNDLTTDQTNFKTQQQLELQRAQDAAAARRKEQLGL